MMSGSSSASTLFEEIFAHIDETFPEHLEATRAFVRQPSISADGSGIPEMTELVATQIRDLGGEAEILPTGGHPVVYGRVDAGASRTLLIYGMYDVQPVEGEVWTVPPFGGEIVNVDELGPCMISRGIMNSKGPLIGFFCAMRALKRVAGSLPVNLKFVIEGEEELGSPHLPEFVERYKERLGADSVFFPFYSQERTGKVVMHLGVKGLVFLELVARGGVWGGPTTRDIHGSNAGWMHSPTWDLVKALATMLSRDQKLILISDFYDDVLPPAAEDLELLKALDSFDERIRLKDHDVRRFKFDLTGPDLLYQFLHRPSLNIDGLVSGHWAEGSKTVLPHEARAKIHIRLVPNMNPARVTDLVHRHLHQSGFAHLEIRQHSAYPWSKSSLSDIANATLLDTYRSIGFQPEVWPLRSGAAPLYLFTRTLGIPVAVGGLGHGGRQHSADEYATVEGMRWFEKSAAAFAVKLGAI
jgi:acetylornithine deacetylase/succinyl-diaminopimelate desuccinylase-like protein